MLAASILTLAGSTILFAFANDRRHLPHPGQAVKLVTATAFYSTAGILFYLGATA